MEKSLKEYESGCGILSRFWFISVPVVIFCLYKAWGILEYPSKLEGFLIYIAITLVIALWIYKWELSHETHISIRRRILDALLASQLFIPLLLLIGILLEINCTIFPCPYL